MSSLKSFIKAVRAAKTIADERAVIQKESAAIRTSFREDYTDQSVRRQNVAKLLYLFTLGERTHFGQIECLKLLATQRFSDKRLGYLGTMLLLDENQEVLTLLTNSLSNDLGHPNQYVVALALCTLANIASAEMARDLFADIEKIISSANPYLKKKAALCAMRIIRKVPDLEENFVEKAKLLLSDKNHGVLLCGAALAQDMCEQNPDLIESFQSSVPTLLNTLKSLASSAGYSPEHDVTGIADPFLQTKILRLLRVLGAGDPQISEQMSDILAQIASNTDSSKNVGNSVLYEAVLTIFGVESDSALRVLGVNILGKFLSNKDNNTKYVALNTLLKVIETEPTAVQRHRATIIDCLQDSDISIRRRALELSFALINEQNVRVLVRELLAFLENADTEFRTNLVSQIAVAAERFSPNRRWHIDTIIRALKLAGGYAKENVLSAFLTLVITSEELHLYAVQKLYAALRRDLTQEGLTLVGVWLIGEYGSTLLQGGSFEDEEETLPVSETEVINVLESVLSSSYCSNTVTEYVLNALTKLSTRVTGAGEVERIRRILESQSRSLDVEIQQRVAEYTKLFGYDAVRKGVLAKMPPSEIRQELAKKYESDRTKGHTRRGGARPSKPTVSGTTAPTTVDLLLDLAGDDNSGDAAGGDAAGSAVTASSTGGSGGQANADLLSDIFGSSSSTPTTSAPNPSNNQSILDLFGSAPSNPPVQRSETPQSATDLLGGLSQSSQPSQPSQPSPSAIEAYNSNGLRVSFQPHQKEQPGVVLITAKFDNSSSSTISDLVLQVAVPKSQKLQLQALSSSTIAPNGNATQNLKVSGNPGSPVKLRLRIMYSIDGREVKDQVDFNKFPSDLL